MLKPESLELATKLAIDDLPEIGHISIWLGGSGWNIQTVLGTTLCYLVSVQFLVWEGFTYNQIKLDSTV